MSVQLLEVYADRRYNGLRMPPTHNITHFSLSGCIATGRGVATMEEQSVFNISTIQDSVKYLQDALGFSTEKTDSQVPEAFSIPLHEHQLQRRPTLKYTHSLERTASMDHTFRTREHSLRSHRSKVVKSSKQRKGHRSRQGLPDAEKLRQLGLFFQLQERWRNGRNKRRKKRMQSRAKARRDQDQMIEKSKKGRQHRMSSKNAERAQKGRGPADRTDVSLPGQSFGTRPHLSFETDSLTNSVSFELSERSRLAQNETPEEGAKRAWGEIVNATSIIVANNRRLMMGKRRVTGSARDRLEDARDLIRFHANRLNISSTDLLKAAYAELPAPRISSFDEEETFDDFDGEWMGIGRSFDHNLDAYVYAFERLLQCAPLQGSSRKALCNGL